MRICHGNAIRKRVADERKAGNPLPFFCLLLLGKLLLLGLFFLGLLLLVLRVVDAHAHEFVLHDHLFMARTNRRMSMSIIVS